MRNDINNPSYKRGLGLTSAILFFYGVAFQIQAVEALAPNVLVYFKYIFFGLGIILSFRAMAERRLLQEQNEAYVSMLDPSVISLRWQATAVGSAIINAIVVYFLFSRDSDFPLGGMIFFAFPMMLFVLSFAYARAAFRWTDEPRLNQD